MISINSLRRTFDPLIQSFKSCFSSPSCKTSKAVENVQLSHDATKSKRLLDKGWAHYIKGDFSKALNYFHRSIGADRTNLHSDSLRALSYLKLGDFKKAKSHAMDTLAFVNKEGIRKSRALYVLGKVGIHEGRNNVEGYFKLALDNHSRNILAQLELAKISFGQSNYKKALLETENVIALSGSSKKPIVSPQEIQESLLAAYKLRSEIFIMRGEFERAKEACHAGLAVDPNDRALTINLAIATSFLNESISNDSPAFIDGLIMADTLQNKKTNISLSENDSKFRKIVYLENLGLSQLKEGKYQEALATFEEGLKEDENSILFYAHRAIANEKLGKKKEALEDAKKSLELFQGFDCLDYLEYECAAAALETIAILVPENREKALELAKALRCGDYVEQQISDSTREEWIALATPPSE